MRATRILLMLLALGSSTAWAQDPLTESSALEVLAGPDEMGRLRALNWLAHPRRSTPIARRRLVEALQDPAPALRRAAANALASLETREAAGALRDALAQEAHPDVVPALLLALGRVGTGEDVPRLDGWAQNAARHDPRHAAAVLALSFRGGKVAVRRALALLAVPPAEDPEASLRATALVALARCGNAAHVPAVLRAVRGDDRAGWLLRSAHARAMGALAPDPVPTLEAHLDDTDLRVAVTAATGLLRRGHGRRLARYLLSPNRVHRLAVVGALGQVPTAGGPTLARALRRRAQEDPHRGVRWAAAKALFLRRDPHGDALVLLALSSSEPAVWTEAVALLASRTGAQHGRDPTAWRAALAADRETR